MGKKARVLIVNNESKYMEGLVKAVGAHSKGKAEIDTVHINDVKSKIDSENVPYDAVILSGSFKRKYDSPEVQYVIKTVDKHNDKNTDNQVGLYGACLGHQAMVHYHKGKIVDLGKYQKGTKKIQLKEGGEAETHKHHRWGVTGVTKASGLEAIANSTVKNSEGKDIKILEAVRHKTKHYVASQGHAARKGHAQDLLYQFMDDVYKRVA